MVTRVRFRISEEFPVTDNLMVTPKIFLGFLESGPRGDLEQESQ